MNALPRPMAASDVADEIGLPDGYRRPMSCQLITSNEVDLDVALRPISVQQIEDLVNEIEADPRHVAVRILELQRDTDIMRAHLETIELRLAGGAR